MPRNPPKPKLHGKSSEAYRDYYRELDEWHDELAAHARRNNLEMKIQKRKNLAAAKDPKVVAQNERNRTKAPARPPPPNRKASKSQFFEKPHRKVEETMNALMEMDMRGELADAPPSKTEKGTIRIQNTWGTRRKRKGR